MKLLHFIKELSESWKLHKSQKMAAALAFYTVLSLPNLVVLLLFISSFFQFDTGSFSQIFGDIFSSQTVQAFTAIIDSIKTSGSKNTVTIVSFVGLIWSATLLFDHIIESFNIIWGVENRAKKNLKKIIFNRIWALAFIIFIQFALVLSFFVRNLIFFIRDTFVLNDVLSTIFFTLLHFFLSFLIPFLLFLFIFKFMSNIKITWKLARTGAFITTFLFVIGSSILNLYFSHFVDFSTFGGASAVVLVLFWSYYISQIIFLGAECTYVLHRSK